jgi:hypothetical protein
MVKFMAVPPWKSELSVEAEDVHVACRDAKWCSACNCQALVLRPQPLLQLLLHLGAQGQNTSGRANDRQQRAAQQMNSLREGVAEIFLLFLFPSIRGPFSD